MYFVRSGILSTIFAVFAIADASAVEPTTDSNAESADETPRNTTENADSSAGATTVTNAGTVAEVTTVASGPVDPCSEVCRLYSVAHNPAIGFDLCGPSGSRCVSGLCTHLYWADLEDGSGGRGLLNSEMETDLTPEEMSDPLTCSGARELIGPPVQNIRGIRDSENTCYLNTALQLLFRTRAVGQFLSTSLPRGDLPPHSQFLRHFLRLRDGVASGDASLDLTSIDVRNDLSSMGFSGFDRGVLGDASEAITGLVNLLDVSVQAVSGANVTRSLASYFAVNSHMSRRCGDCGNEVARMLEPELMHTVRLVPGTAAAHLGELLEHSIRQTENVQVRCSSCQGQFSTMTTRVVPSGEVFMILIGRSAMDGSRINTAVTIPSVLDYDFLPSQYRLIGIANHQGRTANDGHYYAELSHEGSWVRIDNMAVTEIPTPGSTIASTSATVLIYERI